MNSNTQNFLKNEEQEQPTTSKAETRNKKVWSTRPHYKKAGDASDYLKLKNERKSHYIANREQKDKDHQQMIKEAKKRDYENMLRAREEKEMKRKALKSIQERKEQARIGYQKRRNENAERAQYYLKLNSVKLRMNMDTRIRKYAKYHKCPCGFKPNTVITSTDNIHFGCNHKNSQPAIHDHPGLTCKACGAETNKAFKTNCGCMYYRCKRCMRDNYAYKNKGKRFLQFYDKHTSGFGTVTVTIGDVDVIKPNIEKFVDKAIYAKKLPETKENFIRSLQGLPPVTA